MEQLFVYYNQEIVGFLNKNPDATLSFEYADKWIESKNSFSISPQLELGTKGPFDNRATRSFFDNLLPEGKIRGLLEKLAGQSLTDDFQFLKQFGIDCAGAFVISADKEFSSFKVENEFEEIEVNELVKAYEENRNLMAHVIEKHKGKFSIAGAQDKIPLVFYDKKLYVPTKGMPTTHILKPPHMSKAIKDSVYNEYFCMKLAATCGLDVPNVEVLVCEIPFYLIERYDRSNDNGDIQRLHQIDFCQAQGFLSGEKYESDGGPTLQSNYECLKNNSATFLKDTQKYIDWICFNLLIGNNDCHSKNISLLRTNGAYRLSPFYDLLCTSIYKDYDSEFAFKMGKKAFWGQWNIEHFESEVASWGLDKTKDLIIERFRKMEEVLSEKIDEECRLFQEKFPEIRVAKRIKTEVEKRIQSFKRRNLIES